MTKEEDTIFQTKSGGWLRKQGRQEEIFNGLFFFSKSEERLIWKFAMHTVKKMIRQQKRKKNDFDDGFLSWRTTAHEEIDIHWAHFCLVFLFEIAILCNDNDELEEMKRF